MPKRRFVEDLPPEYLTCRRYGHQWQPQNGIRFQVSRNLRGEILTCRSCKTDRVEVRNKRGSLQWRWYDHPRDYHKPKDQVRTNVEELSHEILKRNGGLNGSGWNKPVPDKVRHAMGRRKGEDLR